MHRTRKVFNNYEIQFQDSPEYFYVNNAEMIQEGSMVRFDRFNESGDKTDVVWFPMIHIFKIKLRKI